MEIGVTVAASCIMQRSNCNKLDSSLASTFVIEHQILCMKANVTIQSK